ncbi:flagellar assembly peptidoglycan hydrolase FlgJ [Rheinheimera salexigens]|uniref:Peptidoglycan hydrolase FlgJ n=1 Tax=Rheinheimera salexigens TaxID=1628148 RepID=A0A1E7Q828_9GAMM|nr:flagellar assembly peptidoglycan hydrolase FlgJ [Rheinheimera salexigens]OEY70306.1 flagellar rod assembly protein/muramidase FlgJ [Rheinheimera salexigens]
MSQSPNNVSYHDLTSLQNIRSKAKSDQPGALRQAAEQFEAIFVSMLLTSMRKAGAAFEADGMMNSETTKFYRDMHDSQLATDLAKNGSLGLADLMVQQLSPTAHKKSTPGQPMLLPTDQAMALPSQRQAVNHVLPARAAMQTAAMPITTSATTAMPTAAFIKASQLKSLDEAKAVAEQGKAEQIQATKSVSTESKWQIESPADFVKALLPAAKQTAKMLGLDPMALIAQAALETGWGQRMIKGANGEQSFNFFGIKANNGWQGKTAVVNTLEYRQGVAQKEQAAFRSYSSPEQSLQDYSQFIQNNPRYQHAVKVTQDTEQYFTQLQAAGYATDPAYAKKIMAVYQSPAIEQVRNQLIQEQLAENNTQEMMPDAD